MMAEDGLTLPSSIRGFVQEPNSNPNPNPSANPVKKKRNLPGTPGKNGFFFVRSWVGVGVCFYMFVLIGCLYSHGFSLFLFGQIQTQKS